MDPEDKVHPKFDSVKDIKLVVYPASYQQTENHEKTKTIEQAVDEVFNKTKLK